MSKIFSGTVLGAAAGFMLGGGSILGAVVGGVLGNMFDKKDDFGEGGYSKSTGGAYGSGQRSATYTAETPRVREFVFVSNLVALMTSVAKADKEIHPNEIQAIKRYFTQHLRYTGHDGRVIENLIRESSRRSLNLKNLCNETRRMLEIPERLMLLRMLYTIALSDNVFKQEEKERIETIADYLQIGAADHARIRSEFTAVVSEDHYKVLGLDSTASGDEVKAAYRELVKKYHPDRVSHLGKEFAELAGEKFRTVQEAYDRIGKERGW